MHYLPCCVIAHRQRARIAKNALEETDMQILQPAGWKRPKGYANGVAASGRMLFVAGQVGWDADEIFRSEDRPEERI